MGSPSLPIRGRFRRERPATAGNGAVLRQKLDDLKAEIELRAKLAQQHVSGEVLLPDYYQKPEHDRILLDRVNATRERMSGLVANGVDLLPFLELGAERGQRSLVVANDF